MFGSQRVLVVSRPDQTQAVWACSRLVSRWCTPARSARSPFAPAHQLRFRDSARSGVSRIPCASAPSREGHPSPPTGAGGFSSGPLLHNLPGDVDLSHLVRERAVFGSVGGKFMECQSQGQRSLCCQVQVRSSDTDPVAGIVAREPPRPPSGFARLPSWPASGYHAPARG